MAVTPSRREVLGILLGGAAGLSLSSPSSAQQRSSTVSTGSGSRAPITAVPLSDNLVEFTGAGGNVVVVTGPDGLVMIDGGLRERSADLLKAIAGHTGGKRVQALFNTDWRPEYTGSNETIGKTGAKIIAHENTKQYLGAELFVDWQDRTYKPLPSQALPNQTFYTSGTMTVGGERIDYGHLGQAQTDGAIYVFFPGSNVLMTGDALSVGKYPIPDYTTGGWLGGLIAADTTLLGIANPETRLVPGTGPLQTRADLQAQHDMLNTMMDRFKKMMKQGLGPEDIIAAAPTKEFDVKWGDPDRFVYTAYRSMWLHVRELGGIV
jgi:glyoxylase-like metal-dependent hydrolase (beta-lactamase superfamily II)